MVGAGDFRLETRAANRRLNPVSWLLHLYWRFSRGMTLGVRAAVLNGHGEVFLVRHTYTPGWHLPGGGVEPGETMLDAIIKELNEEASIQLVGKPHFHGVFFNNSISNRDHVGVFVVREFTQANLKKPDAEIAEARFFAIAELPEGTTRGTRIRLQEICAGDVIAAEW